MRLLVRVAAAIASMRAPVSPLSANSCVATAKISAMVRAGSLVRPVSLAAAGAANESLGVTGWLGSIIFATVSVALTQRLVPT